MLGQLCLCLSHYLHCMVVEGANPTSLIVVNCHKIQLTPRVCWINLALIGNFHSVQTSIPQENSALRDWSKNRKKS